MQDNSRSFPTLNRVSEAELDTLPYLVCWRFPPSLAQHPAVAEWIPVQKDSLTKSPLLGICMLFTCIYIFGVVIWSRMKTSTNRKALAIVRYPSVHIQKHEQTRCRDLETQATLSLVDELHRDVHCNLQHLSPNQVHCISQTPPEEAAQPPHTELGLDA